MYGMGSGSDTACATQRPRFPLVAVGLDSFIVTVLPLFALKVAVRRSPVHTFLHFSAPAWTMVLPPATRYRLLPLAAAAAAGAAVATMLALFLSVSGLLQDDTSAGRPHMNPDTDSLALAAALRNRRGGAAVRAAMSWDEYTTTPPRQGALFWRLWAANRDLAKQSVNTTFISSIRNGSLSPDAYGGWTISDAYYCFHSARSYQLARRRAAASAREGDAALAEFLALKAAWYREYNEYFRRQWHLQSPDCIEGTLTINSYARLERDVAARLDPVYTLVVMLPCEWLWAWLVAQVRKGRGPENTIGWHELYDEWLDNNEDTAPAFAMGNFLQRMVDSRPGAVNDDMAMKLYRQAMQYEVDNFNAV